MSDPHGYCCFCPPTTATEAHFRTDGCQIRHLARIFTVDNAEKRELNSFRRVSKQAGGGVPERAHGAVRVRHSRPARPGESHREVVER